MIEKVKAPISILSFYNHKTRVFSPKVILWEGRNYYVKKVGYHHQYRQGKTLYHVYSVETPELYFRLVCNTDNLSWEVQEVSDGETD